MEKPQITLPSFSSLLVLLQIQESPPFNSNVFGFQASEECIFNYITYFTSTLDIYTGILKQFENDVLGILSESQPQSEPQSRVLTGLDFNNRPLYTTSTKLRKLALTIPDSAYKNILDSTLLFSHILKQMESIKEHERSRQSSISEENKNASQSSPASSPSKSLVERSPSTSPESVTNENTLLVLLPTNLSLANVGSSRESFSQPKPAAIPQSNAPTVKEKNSPPKHDIRIYKKESKEVSRHKSRISRKKYTASCIHCGTSSTPEWRRGADGSRTLCNACGLFYSKLRRKFGKHSEFGEPVARDIMAYLKYQGQCLMRNVPEFSEAREILRKYHSTITNATITNNTENSNNNSREHS